MTERRGALGRRTLADGFVGLGPAARRRHLTAHHRCRAPRGPTHTADARRPRSRHRSRPSRSPSRLRRRTRRLAEGGGPGRRRDERDQGRGDRTEPSAPLVVTGRCVAVREQREPCHVRCDAVRCRCLVARPPALDAHQGGSARPRAGWPAVVGPRRPAADRSRRHRVVGRGPRRRSACIRRLQQPRSAVSSIAPSTRPGSTPNHATASPAARSAHPSSATDRWCCSTGRARPTRHRRPPTNSAMRTTTPRWPAGPLCNASSRWRSPRQPASSARPWWSRPAWHASTAPNASPNSTSISSAPIR